MIWNQRWFYNFFAKNIFFQEIDDKLKLMIFQSFEIPIDLTDPWNSLKVTILTIRIFLFSCDHIKNIQFFTLYTFSQFNFFHHFSINLIKNDHVSPYVHKDNSHKNYLIFFHNFHKKNFLSIFYFRAVSFCFLFSSTFANYFFIFFCT